MKPALDVACSASHDPYQNSVCCLRCERKLERYQLMRISLMPNGGTPGYAILSCPKCGHVEFVSDSSPLLQSLELVSVDAGDGD
jgi:RNase P subunit RPR2